MEMYNKRYPQVVYKIIDARDHGRVTVETEENHGPIELWPYYITAAQDQSRSE